MHQLISGGLLNMHKNMSKIIDAHDARVHFGQLLDEVRDKEHTFIIKRRGKPAAIILNIDDYTDFLDIKTEIDDKEMNNALHESQRQFKLGEVGTEKDIFNILRGA